MAIQAKGCELGLPPDLGTALNELFDQYSNFSVGGTGDLGRYDGINLTGHPPTRPGAQFNLGWK